MALAKSLPALVGDCASGGTENLKEFPRYGSGFYLSRLSVVPLYHPDVNQPDGLSRRRGANRRGNAVLPTLSREASTGLMSQKGLMLMPVTTAVVPREAPSVS